MRTEKERKEDRKRPGGKDLIRIERNKKITYPKTKAHGTRPESVLEPKK
jgi:hypothetical protein